MRRFSRAVLAAGAALCVGLVPAAPAAASATTTASPVRARATGFACVAAKAAKPPVPGVVLDVHGPGVDFTGAAGNFRAGGRKLRPTDAFRAASVTKTFTAAAVLKLAEQGKVGLEDRIGEYLDPGLVKRLSVIGGRSYGETITVRQLLDHTAGLYDYAADAGWMAAVQARPHRTWTSGELLDWALTHGKPYFKPGEGYHYSDTGYVLAARIIEKATGRPLHQAYRSLLLDPLKLHDTYLERRGHQGDAPLSHPYLGETDARHWNPTFDTHGGGGLVTTAADLTAFTRALFEGRVFAKAATLRTMLTPTRQSGDEAYGLGIQRVGSGDDSLWLHPGFWGAIMAYAPARRISVVATVNQAEDGGALLTLLQDAYKLAAGGSVPACA
ncbi:serine hydrolase domain-containing protein [Nonomuraea pusilla]|uniref:D-alanyl-D-alanine carboxypeptidase n=1 Tax=Nonomuraea pusilla TaxID=46177 RepID=A0A1H8HE44_9ACTN|nr:serine hydrolase domain-containing protein [Nonomuraea pusilla]SEN54541.1 D-alanyl-D-alanine carboxypeptidase [Nonomuraea pusilla]